MDAAIFLDRDGVLIDNVDQHVRSWEDVVILPKTLPTLALLSNSAYKIVLVSNQSAVGRGLISFDTAWSVHNRLVQVIAWAGGRVDGSYLCLHAPWEGCACRKPKPGLLQEAAAALSIDLERSFMIGDALTDIQAGRNAGVRASLLVRTGRGDAQLALPEARALPPFLVFADLEEAVKAILAGRFI